MRALALAPVALLAAAGAALAAQDAPAATVRLVDFRFEPAVVTVPPGATILLVGAGELDDHTYTSADDAFPFDHLVRKGESRNVTAPPAPATIAVYCRLHAGPSTTPEQGMAGRLVVAQASSNSTGDGAGVPLAWAVAVGGLVAAAAARRR